MVSCKPAVLGAARLRFDQALADGNEQLGDARPVMESPESLPIRWSIATHSDRQSIHVPDTMSEHRISPLIHPCWTPTVATSSV